MNQIISINSASNHDMSILILVDDVKIRINFANQTDLNTVEIIEKILLQSVVKGNIRTKYARLTHKYVG